MEQFLLGEPSSKKRKKFNDYDEQLFKIGKAIQRNYIYEIFKGNCPQS